MGLLVLGGFIFLPAFLLLVMFGIRGQRRLTAVLASASNFEANQQWMDGLGGIAFDAKRKAICIFDRERATIIDGNDLIAVELLKNGQSITRSARGSQVGCALAGGALLGGVGLVVGGLSGKQVTRIQVTDVQLLITVRNFAQPLHRLKFGSYEGIGDHWHSLLKVLIQESAATAPSAPPAQASLT
jgi:hypothetical protein